MGGAKAVVVVDRKCERGIKFNQRFLWRGERDRNLRNWRIYEMHC